MYRALNSPPWRGGTECRGGFTAPPHKGRKSDLRLRLPPPLQKEALGFWDTCRVGFHIRPVHTDFGKFGWAAKRRPYRPSFMNV